MDGQPCRLPVDTGAEKTLVRSDMLAAKCLPDAQQRLCGVKGHCVELKGPVETQWSNYQYTSPIWTSLSCWALTS